MRFLNDVKRGVKRHPWKTSWAAFLVFSAIWTATEALSYFIPGFDIRGPYFLVGVAIFSIGFSLFRVAKPLRIEIKIPHTDTVLEVMFGDLFAQPGFRAIAVNEFFDSELGKVVAEESLHGIFLIKCCGRHREAFDKQVEVELADVSFETANREIGKKRRYPIGSAALLTLDTDRYIAFALTATDLATLKAHADVHMLWQALRGLWEKTRIETGGQPLNVPLIGSGLAGLGLPTRDILNLIILSAIAETKQKQITRRIRIVLWKDRYDDVDLRDVKKFWEEH